jgi:hypothetical protein
MHQPLIATNKAIPVILGVLGGLILAAGTATLILHLTIPTLFHGPEPVPLKDPEPVVIKSADPIAGDNSPSGVTSTDTKEGLSGGLTAAIAVSCFVAAILIVAVIGSRLTQNSK